MTFRPPGEYLLLACLVGSFVFCGYQAFKGTFRLEGGSLAVALVAACLAIGALAFLFIIMRRKAGAILCAAFYGIQMFRVELASGWGVGFNTMPTIYIRIQGDEHSATIVNLSSVVLFCLSLALWASYRQRSNGNQ